MNALTYIEAETKGFTPVELTPEQEEFRYNMFKNMTDDIATHIPCNLFPFASTPQVPGGMLTKMEIKQREQKAAEKAAAEAKPYYEGFDLIEPHLLNR